MNASINEELYLHLRNLIQRGHEHKGFLYLHNFDCWKTVAFYNYDAASNDEKAFKWLEKHNVGLVEAFNYVLNKRGHDYICWQDFNPRKTVQRLVMFAGKDVIEQNKYELLRFAERKVVILNGFGEDSWSSNMSNPAARASLMRSDQEY